ncbi:MAG: YfiH family protein [Flavobacterium sp.]|jgi:YfiH family protein
MKAGKFIEIPDWNQPENINIAITSRWGGVSAAPFDEFNLAGHVGDEDVSVLRNRKTLCDLLEQRRSPIWLQQVHSKRVLSVGDAEDILCLPKADGAFADQVGTTLAVMTADCMPILMCSDDGQEFAAVHAGWRGLAAGIIESAFNKFRSQNLNVYLGPAIGPCHYEVGQEVKDSFPVSKAFIASERNGHWMFDMFGEAENQFQSLGVKKVTRSKHCTYCNGSLFSYRRDGKTGRFASLIWRVD